MTPQQQTLAAPPVLGVPLLLLRLEGALVLGAALVAYAQLGGSWLTFALAFLLPDLTLLGYLAGARVGAILYNTAHSYLAPGVLAGVGLAIGSPALVLAAVIWIAHAGFDRLAGYGLKYGTGFRDTHLGRIGRAKAA